MSEEKLLVGFGEEWEKTDPKTRMIPFSRYVYGVSGAIRRVQDFQVEQDSKGEWVTRLNMEDHYASISSNCLDLMAPDKQFSPPKTKILAENSFRTWSINAVLLPPDWKPGDSIHPHPERVKKAEEKKQRDADNSRINAEWEKRRAQERKVAEQVEAHMQKQWEDSEYILVSFQDDAFSQADLGHFKQVPGAKNWVARVWADQKAPGGLGREFLNRVPGNYPAVVVDRIRVGDYLEVAADEVTHGGRRIPDRLYYRVLWENPQKGRTAILHRLEDKPPILLKELTIDEEIGILNQWISGKDESDRLSKALREKK